nr:probable glucan 1,3-beta-glucosidase A [Tanacetum cinerariifolium]
DHWETFIVEKDFKFIAESGLNAVRIPVGWWTASDPTPPKPFVGGSLQYLDKAFLWAEKYNLKVILDLQAAPGSQNGFEHSATRDGLIEWGLTDENIQQTVRVIEFFPARYAANPSLYTVQLINEPHASGVPLDLAVMQNSFFLLPRECRKSLLMFITTNHFADIFNDMTVDQNINFIQTNRFNDLQDITTSDGPLTFVGEWVAEWQVREASKEDFQRFSQAQLDVFGRASFGTLNSKYQKIRAVNLEGWLVTEGWMKPSLFDTIPNNDLLDGTTLQFKLMTSVRYLSAEHGGGSIIVANRTSAKSWETFKLWRINGTSFHIRVFNKRFLGLDSFGVNLVAYSTESELTSGIFEIIKKSSNSSLVRIKAPNGLFVQAKSKELVTADSKGDGPWGDKDPSVFNMSITENHWKKYIVEKDFDFIATSRLNAVRIPVGWWTARDPTPPKPYVGGSLHYLDKAFLWAKKRHLKVILDLHCAPGSQNGYEHSSTRDGSLEWGQTDESIQETLRVIEFFTAREWVAEGGVKGASKDYKRYAKVQQEVFGRASFGWAYWSLKNVNNHWSMEWMIKSGYIRLKKCS